jgi:hypothetical protein
MGTMNTVKGVIQSVNGHYVEVDNLIALYAANTAYKSAFDHFARRNVRDTETTVEMLEYALRREVPKVTRTDVIELFRQLATLNCGTFFVGRKGKSSRFRWRVGLASVGLAASGQSSEIEYLSDDEQRVVGSYASSDTDDTVKHRYVLRQDFEVQIDLPADLNAVEAERLAGFIRTLPFSG